MITSLSVVAIISVSPPNIIHIVGDDIGHNDFNFSFGTDPLTIAPNIEKLANGGVILDDLYTFKLCAPSRGQIMTGRYTYHFGYYDNIDVYGPTGGIMLNYTLTPFDLKKAGYATHAIGKWHCGFQLTEQTPTYRHFDSFLGYYHAEENYYTQMYGNTNSADCGNRTCCGIDFSEGNSPNEIRPSSRNGTYSTYTYTSRAVGIIQNHPIDKPLYMYLPFQNIHGPTEAPDRFKNLYNQSDFVPPRSRIVACLSALDEAVGNITNALKEKGIWSNTIIVFHSDNGGDIGVHGNGMNNYPLRGGKWTHWEGGVRIVGFIHSPLLPESRRGTHYDGILHVTDWRATWAALAGVEPDNSGPYPVDGFNIWPALLSGGESPRNEVVHQVLTYPWVNQSCSIHNWDHRSTTCHYSNCGGSIRIGKYKLMLGYPGFPDHVFPIPYPKHPDQVEECRNATIPGTLESLPCNNGCLFDLSTDISEAHDVSAEFPEIVTKMTNRLLEVSKEGLPRRNQGIPDPPTKCHIVRETGYWQPYMD